MVQVSVFPGSIFPVLSLPAFHNTVQLISSDTETYIMEESKSPLKSIKPSRGEIRGTKSTASKTLKDTPLLRDPTKGPSRIKDNISRARDDHRDSQGTHSSGRMAAGSPQDQGRGKARRLTGRTSSGERGKGKGGCPQQQADARQSAHDQRAPGWSRNLKDAEGPGEASPSSHEEKTPLAKPSKGAALVKQSPGT